MEASVESRRRKRKSSSNTDESIDAKTLIKSTDSSNDDSTIAPLIPSNFRVPSMQQTATSDVIDNDNDQLVLTITCGYFSAKLHMDKFYCPGIHQLCIEYNGQFISPKQLTILAGKDKQKDWKAAVKLNQQPMRVLFEKHKIDFYKHSDFCSGRCVSKIVKPSGSSNDNMTADNGDSNVLTLEPTNSDEVDYKMHLFNVNQQSTSSDSNNSQTELGDSTIFSDPDTFWTAVYQLGIFYELTQEIDEQVNVLRTCFKIPEMRSKIARKLSDLVKVMDLKEKIHARLVTKRSLTKAQCVVVENELTELKKIAENQEKKQREFQRKSDILDQLIGQRCVDLSVPNPLPSP